MNQKYKSLAKDTLIFAIGSLGSKLILFFLVPIYTNYLSPEEYGTTELIYTVEQLLVPFASMLIYDAVLRFGLSKKENPTDVLKCGLLVTTIGAIVALFATPLVGLYQSIANWKWYVSIYCILNMYSSLFLNYLKVKNRNLLFAISSIVQTVTLAGLNILFLCFFNMKIEGFLLATLASYFSGICVCFCYKGLIRDLCQGVANRKLLSEMLLYSVPLIFNSVSWWIIHSTDKFMIEYMISTSALGIYTAASKIPSLINVITSIFQQAWGLSAIKEIEDDNDAIFYSNIFKLLTTTVFGISMVVILLIKPFMSIYVGKAFSEAWLLIPLLLVGACYCTISSFFGAIYSALKRSLNSMMTTMVAGTINIILNYFLIRKIGIMGAVIATAISYIAISIIRIADSRRFLKFDLGVKPFVINSIILLVQSFAISVGKNVYVISLLALIMFVFFNLRQIKIMVKMLAVVMRRKLNR